MSPSKDNPFGFVDPFVGPFIEDKDMLPDGSVGFSFRSGRMEIEMKGL
jgi:hypothetical protein